MTPDQEKIITNAMRDVARDRDAAEQDCARLRAEVAKLEAEKSGAYAERNKCAAGLAYMAVSLGLKTGIGQHVGEEWEPDWRTIVFIDLPTGQVSWHFHDSEKGLLLGLPRYAGKWDGHSTEEKYRRLLGWAGVSP